MMCKYKYSSLGRRVDPPGGESEACWRKLWAMGPMTGLSRLCERKPAEIEVWGLPAFGYKGC